MWVSENDRWRRLFWLLNKWFALKNFGIKLDSCASCSKGKKIAVYGLGEIGKRLMEELECSNMKVEYVVDKRADSLFTEFEIYSPTDKLPPADIMIVSVINDYDSICEMLKESFCGEVVSLETIIDNLWINYWEGKTK